MRIASNRLTGRRRAATWMRRGAVLAGVVGVTMLGNLRLQASEIGRLPASSEAVTARPAASPEAPVSIERVDLAIASHRRPVDAMTDEDDGSTEDDDAIQLVPAIYAWDPDVRFVYFRHVSKWM